MKILVDPRGKKYLANDSDLHTNKGYIKKEEIIKSSPGNVLRTHLGTEFKVINADLNDYIELMERRSSIILPKDLGVTIAYTGLGSGMRVVEAGTGSGASTLFLGNIVGERGAVYSYEIREDFYDMAKRNIETYGMKHVHLKNKDIKDGVDEKNIDLVFLDLPKPWELISQVSGCLKIGGYIAIYTPYIEQFLTVQKILKKYGFNNIIILENMIREYEVKTRGSRPKTRAPSHTGYITIGRYYGID